jgi:hypothetical protein
VTAAAVNAGFQPVEHFACIDPTGADAEAAQAIKERATLVATFALNGVELVLLADGTWLAQRWGQFKPLADEAEARAWLARVTGKQA